MMPFKLVSITFQSGSFKFPYSSKSSLQNEVDCNPALATTISICRQAVHVVWNNVNMEDHDCTSARIYTHRLRSTISSFHSHTSPDPFQIVCHRCRSRH